MRCIVVLAIMLVATGCDIYVADAGDAQEARLANDFLNAQLADDGGVIVNWQPTKNHIKLHVLAPVDADRKESAISALRKKQAEEGWRTIEVNFKNGEVERLEAGT